MIKLVSLVLALLFMFSCSEAESSEDVVMGDVILPKKDSIASQVQHVNDLLKKEAVEGKSKSEGKGKGKEKEVSVYISCKGYTSDFETYSNEEKSTLLSKDLSAVSEEIFILVNEFRASKGLDPLTWNLTATMLALDHCVYQLEKGVASHDLFAARFCAMSNIEGIHQLSENTARGQRSATEVMNAWKKSKVHCGNLLGDFDEIGIASVISPEGQHFFTQLFVKY